MKGMSLSLRAVIVGIIGSAIWIAIVLLATHRNAVGADRLTGEMGKLSYLLGKWTCKEYLRDTNAIPSVMTFEISGHNTIHEHWESTLEDAQSDSYFGYSATAHVFYVARASGGGVWFGTSLDGMRYSEASQGLGLPEISTFAFENPSPDTLKIHSQTFISGMETDGGGDCSR